jgi:hypothetical protein
MIITTEKAATMKVLKKELIKKSIVASNYQKGYEGNCTISENEHFHVL